MRRFGEPLPDDAQPPPPTPWAGFYLAAFWDLSTERPNNGWTIGPIPWSPIHAYGKHHGLRGQTLDAFVFCIRRLDACWLTWQRENQPKEPPKK